MRRTSDSSTATMLRLGVGLLLAALVQTGWAWNKDMENPAAFQGDMILTPEQQQAAKEGTLSYGSVTYGRWPGAKVPYYIESSIRSKGIRAIEEAVRDYHRYTCIRFSKRQSQTNYISFYSGPGCLSPVGMRRGTYNRISLAAGCWDKGTVLHEIGHSLGLFHEQSRPDRDKYVTIHYRNIQRGLAYAFDIQRGIDSLGTPYDLKSMMHYSSTAFSTGGKTITTKDPEKQSLIDTYNRISGFSPIDIVQINKMYCNGNIPATLPPPVCKDSNLNCKAWADRGECRNNPRYMLVNCKMSCKKC